MYCDMFMALSSDGQTRIKPIQSSDNLHQPCKNVHMISWLTDVCKILNFLF